MKTISFKRMANLRLKPVLLGARFRPLFGPLAANSNIYVSGPPKQGKSTFCLALAAHLAKVVGPVLYIAAEETGKKGVAGTLVQRARRLGEVECPQRLLICNEPMSAERLLGEDLAKIKVVVLDSLQAIGFGRESLAEFCGVNADKLIIGISQVNNKGQSAYREYEHMADCSVVVKGGLATCRSRYNAAPVTAQIFDKRGKLVHMGLYDEGN